MALFACADHVESSGLDDVARGLLEKVSTLYQVRDPGAWQSSKVLLAKRLVECVPRGGA